MSVDENKALARRFIQVWVPGNLGSGPGGNPLGTPFPWGLRNPLSAGSKIAGATSECACHRSPTMLWPDLEPNRRGGGGDAQTHQRSYTTAGLESRRGTRSRGR
jgi:hypothetical protein